MWHAAREIDHRMSDRGSDGACPNCGVPNSPSARFCNGCGNALATGAPARESRRTVTILFCDVVGSTALGEQLDPEALRGVMSRYFTLCKTAIEAHGGSMEKFIGDAVMAVFGIPIVHEDDALRAVRAASDIRAAIDALRGDLASRQGLGLDVRIGINTGEVVAGDSAPGQTLVSGDAVNTAARLQQAAAPGEIVLGDTTYRLVHAVVAAERMPDVAAKGKSQPVAAHRLTGIPARGDAAAPRRLDAPLIGREQELEWLLHGWRNVCDRRVAQLFTIVAPAGVGKSRLLREFLDEVARSGAVVLAGRCLPYGAGITYWAIGEAIRAAAGVDEATTVEAERDKLASLVEGMRDAPIVASRLAAAIGLSSESAAQEELFWAVRRTLEHLAERRPTVLLIEDIHWAEPTLLDLLEYVVELATAVPLAIVCAARPELLVDRPGWGTGRNTALFHLEPLQSGTAGRLLAGLPGGTALPQALATRISETAEGNPLFLEEMVAMLRDDGLLVEQEGHWVAQPDLADISVPPSVGAVVAARIDGLPSEERAVAERASVVGRIFEAAAVRELTAEPRAVGRSLLALVRKELIRPERSDITAGDAFKFRHILLRDAAYEGLPKRERAELHERFANWLERAAGDRLTEYQEIVGYHLEHAHRYRVELMEVGAAVDGLALRAVEHLEPAARRALERSDLSAAKGLLDRSVSLVSQRDVRRAGWLADGVYIDCELGQLGSATEKVDQLRVLAEAPDSTTSTRAWHTLAHWHTRYVLGQFDNDGARRSLGQVITTFRGLSDERGLTRTYLTLAQVDWLGLRGGPTVHALVQARGHARRAGTWNDELAILVWLTRALAWGPAPAPAALKELEEIEKGSGDDRRMAACVARTRAYLLAMQGHATEALAIHHQAIALFADLGMTIDVGEAAQSGAFVAEYAGDFDTAQRWLEESCELLRGLGEAGLYPTNASFLARLHVRAGRLDAAAQWLDEALRLASPDDLATQSTAHAVQALLLAKRGDHEQAIATAGRTVTLVDAADTDFLTVIAETLADAAEAYEVAGAHASAVALFTRVLELHRRKGNVMGARWTEQRLAELQPRASG